MISGIIVGILILGFFGWLALFFVTPILKFAVPIAFIIGIIFLIKVALALWIFWVPIVVGLIIFHEVRSKSKKVSKPGINN
ncbi:hypothetical protein N6G96_07105 [Pediococcus inopinatus]|uniref:Phage shock protein G n=1 Tax=Pediococcus inopinatus TaxID=114090 RepID=A0ABZ0Q3F7_9LACO|nr:hypothetical protein [Pediococcus inopinatus]WPC19269.1 hypothetical protein N6G95_08535 [Pediococcus inopinatus]WPC21057.1 hypothetical protein N6G96_07105 [Pediococcus inopinatus]